LTDPISIQERMRLRAAADSGSPLSPEATRQVVQELTLHRRELELQNTELQRTQLQLMASRARYFDLYNRAPVGYFTLTLAGLIHRANLTAADLLGVARGALVKQPLTRFILPADQDIYYLHHKQLVESGTRQVCELRMIKGNGDPCWVRLEATAAKVTSGGLVYRAVMSDISERRQAEETLRASEERHRVLFEKSHDALMTLAPPNWHFTSGNKTTLGMFGARHEADFLSHAPEEYSPERQQDGEASLHKAARMIEVALRDGSHFYEWTHQRLSGQEFPSTVLLTRIEIDGHPLLQATVRDETEVKRLQAMLRQSDRLASMGTLAAGVAHEINNPPTYVLNNIETLTEDFPKLAASVEHCVQTLRVQVGDKSFARVMGAHAEMLQPSMLNELAERARDALDGTERIKSISRAIGTFSRVESNERFRVDLNYAIECAVTLAMTAIKFRAKLVLNLAALPQIWASAGKLSQVFLNLLINAAHAIDEGAAGQNEIAIRTWALGDSVFAEVKDTGRGISEGNLGRIFEPFFSTKAAGAGSGLGLPICRNIVSEFGGDIRVESALGHGTCFIVRLPIQAGASQTPPALPRAPIPEVLAVRGRILLVDDERPILTMLVKLLAGDHDLVTAISGAEAQALLEHDQTFDVILCDLMMAEMTGMALHEWLVAQHPSLAARVVFATGGAFTRQASQFLAGVDNVRLEKPYESKKLLLLMTELVAAARNPSQRLARDLQASGT
jgi:two-component system, cell cycle sensor histidine kinase and response regulator CckA